MIFGVLFFLLVDVLVRRMLAGGIFPANGPCFVRLGEAFQVGQVKADIPAKLDLRDCPTGGQFLQGPLGNVKGGGGLIGC